MDKKKEAQAAAVLQRVFDSINSLHKEFKQWPTIHEIVDDTSLTFKQVEAAVKALIADGKITREK